MEHHNFPSRVTDEISEISPRIEKRRSNRARGMREFSQVTAPQRRATRILSVAKLSCFLLKTRGETEVIQPRFKDQRRWKNTPSSPPSLVGASKCTLKTARVAIRRGGWLSNGSIAKERSGFDQFPGSLKRDGRARQVRAYSGQRG